MLSPKLLWAKTSSTRGEHVITMSPAPPLPSQEKISVFTDLLQACVTCPTESQQPTKSLSQKQVMLLQIPTEYIKENWALGTRQSAPWCFWKWCPCVWELKLGILSQFLLFHQKFLTLAPDWEGNLGWGRNLYNTIMWEVELFWESVCFLCIELISLLTKHHCL